MVAATAEVATLMNITQCIMSAQSNQPIVGAVLDTLTGAYLLTSEKQPVTRAVGYEELPSGERIQVPLKEIVYRSGVVEYAYDAPPSANRRFILEEPVLDAEGKPVLREIEIDPGLFNDCITLMTQREQLISLNERLAKYNVPRFSGRALFSALLPPDFYYKKTSKIGDTPNTVLIMEGVLVQGIITKQQIGATHNSIVQALWKEYRAERTVDFLTDLPFVIDQWLSERGFSVGLRDCFPVDESHKTMLKTEMAKTKVAVQALGGKLEDKLEEEQREKKIIGLVNTVSALGHRISTEKLAPDNALNVMAFAGTKGETFNIAQITGQLGQQFFKGQRIKSQLEEGTRTLPYFEADDEDIRAKGFIEHSFTEGMTPAEFMAHHTTAREGLMDTALKTAETGFIQRKLMESLRDVSVAHDGSVRNATNHIIQPLYGYDGFEGSELQMVKDGPETIASFVDLASLADKINVKYGVQTPLNG